MHTDIDKLCGQHGRSSRSGFILMNYGVDIDAPSRREQNDVPPPPCPQCGTFYVGTQHCAGQSSNEES